MSQRFDDVEMQGGEGSKPGKSSLEHRELVCLRRSLDAVVYALSLTRNERDEQTRATKEMQDVAVRYRDAYRMLLNSRFVKVWLKIRALLGRKYLFVDDQVPLLQDVGIDYIDPENEPFINGYKEDIALIHSSNGSAYYRRSDLKIGIIADSFMYSYYDDAIDLVYLDPIHYEELIDENDLACILCISCWRGLGHISETNELLTSDYLGDDGLEAIGRVLDYAKNAGVPIIFQSIEDPPSYERFLPLAKRADVIFTSAEEMIPHYVADTGNSEVHVLNYGINPLMHNPIGFLRKRTMKKDYLVGGVLFAGTYYKNFPKRRLDTEVLFDGVNETESAYLYIADRNFNRADHASFAFPEKYRDHVIPSFEYDELQKVHKLFDYSINLNTITNSTTMCARRVYELQALGCLQLSNYSLSISRSFPALSMVVDKNEVPNILEGYADNEVISMQIENARRLLRASTVFERLDFMLETIGIPGSRATHRVTTIVPDDANVEAIFDNQVGVDIDIVFQSDLRNGNESLGQFAMFWPGEQGNPYYLLDMVNAFKFVDVDYVRYADWGDWETAYDYVEGVPEAYGTLFKTSSVDLPSMSVGMPPKCIHGFNVLAPKWGRDTSACRKELGVVIPVTDNGLYAKTRCFMSLLRSSVFGSMVIRFICFPDIDKETKAALSDLSAAYDNVLICHSQHHSTESDLIDVGLDLCCEPYVSVVDPYCEIVNDGFALLLDCIKGSDVDFAFGDYVLVPGDEARGENGRCAEGETSICDPIGFLVDNDFRLDIAFHCVATRGFLVGNRAKCVSHIHNPYLILFLQMAAGANRVGWVDEPVCIQYDDRLDDQAVESESSLSAMLAIVGKERE